MNHMDLHFDVVVVTYKVNPEFLTRCLDSIKSQTHTDYTVWICDGTPEDYGSDPADSSSYDAIMETFAPYLLDSRFNLLRQTGRGVSQARNQAVAAGTAPYVATLDGDDFWYPEHLEWMAEAISETCESQPPVAYWWAGADAEIKLQSLKNGKIYATEGIIGWFSQWSQVDPKNTFFFVSGHPILPSNSVFLRSRFETIGGYQESLQIGEDTDLFLRMAGSPVTHPYGHPELFVGHQIDAVSGYHGCGPWQTTTMGHQSSAADNRDFFQVQAEFERQQAERIATSSYTFEYEDRPEHISPEEWDIVWNISNQKTNQTTIFDTAQV